MDSKLYDAMLQIFDGAGAEAGSQAGPDSSQPGTGETEVLYGKQQDTGSDAGSAQEETTEETTETPEQREARYRSLMQGEFKDLYAKDTQRIINKKVRENKTLRDKMQQQSGVLDSLMARYGIEDGDLSKLQSALDSDEAYWQVAAEQAGMTKEQYKTLMRTRQENIQLRSQRMSIEQEARTRQLVESWQQEAEQLRSIYPDFDLGKFLENPQNIEYMKHHVPMRMVYEYYNRDQINAGIAAQTAQRTEQAVVSNIRAKGARPKENGATPAPSAVIKDDVNALTNEDIDEIMRRVQRGEMISF